MKVDETNCCENTKHRDASPSHNCFLLNDFGTPEAPAVAATKRPAIFGGLVDEDELPWEDDELNHLPPVEVPFSLIPL